MAVRTIDLLKYLPEYVTDYQEPVSCLEAENPEFDLLWDNCEKVLSNRFIATADEYGLSRFEEMLGILPDKDATLESRRDLVWAKWFSSLPYTWRMLIDKFIMYCGNSDFSLTNDFEDGYTIYLGLNLDSDSIIKDIESLMESWVPVNVQYFITNTLTKQEITGVPRFAGGISIIEKHTI